MLYYTPRDWNRLKCTRSRTKFHAQPLIKWLFEKELKEEVKTKSFSRNGKIQLINLLIVNNVSKFKINELRSMRESNYIFTIFPFRRPYPFLKRFIYFKERRQALQVQA